MAVIESVIAFNASFAVLKKTIQNGRKIGGVLGSLANIVGTEEDLRAGLTVRSHQSCQKHLARMPT